MVPFGQLGHSHGSLTHGSLSIQPSLSGDDQVGVPDEVLQVGLLQHDGNSGLQHPTEEGLEGKAQPSGGTGARCVGVGGVWAHGLGQLGVME